MSLRERPLVLFDADCGFCQRCIPWIGRLGARVDVAALQTTDLGELGVPEARTTQEMPAILPDGEIRWGARAWAVILTSAPRPVRWAGTVLDAPPVRPLAGAAYRWIAANRWRLPGGSAACRLP